MQLIQHQNRTNSFPNALERLLPESALENFDAIYGDLVTQVSYEIGSPERTAIQEAYGFAQRRMLIAALCVMALSLVWVTMIKNIRVDKKDQQMKGVLL